VFAEDALNFLLGFLANLLKSTIIIVCCFVIVQLFFFNSRSKKLFWASGFITGFQGGSYEKFISCSNRYGTGYLLQVTL